MNLILLIVVILLLFGGGGGYYAYNNWGPQGGIGIVGIVLIIIVVLFVTGRGRFTLRRRPRGRTRFCWEERLTFPGWMGGIVGEQVARPILRAIWRRNLRRLKDQLEH